MDANTPTRLARAMATLINVANIDTDAAKALCDHIILEEQVAVRTAARVATQTPVTSTFDTITPINNAAGIVVQTPASPTSHKLANQVMPQTLDTNNTTAAGPKSKTCYTTFPCSTLMIIIDESSSARFLRQVKATPNKAIGNLLLSDKKRKPDEDLTSADAKKVNGAVQAGDAAAAAVDDETTMTDADIQAQIDQLERQNKLAKLQAELSMRKEATKKAQGGMASVGDVGR